MGWRFKHLKAMDNHKIWDYFLIHTQKVIEALGAL